MIVLGDGDISKPNDTNLKKVRNLYCFISAGEGEFFKLN
jgi:hypothetical protein